MKKKKEDRVERDLFLTYASVYYASVEDNFVSAAKAMAKKKYGINLTPELQKLMEFAYKIGFADAMYLDIDRDDHDESYREEPTCKPRATTAR
jgi:hypothetical protein